jgi:integrase
MRAKRLSDEGVSKLAVKAKRYAVPDPELRGHYVRVAPTGARSFWSVARDKHGKQRWLRIGDADMGIDAARDQAMKLLRAIRSSSDTAIVVNTSFEGVASDWFERHVVRNGLRSEPTIRGFLRGHILPAFVGMDFVNVRRKHISAMLDKVEDQSGTRSANYVLSVITSICTWYALRDDEYENPIVRGMKRGKREARSRILSEDEIRALWNADGEFGNFTKLALLTAQRVGKLYTLKWDDISDDTWTIRTERREKGNANSLSLPQLALEVLKRQRNENPDPEFVFDGNGTALRGRLYRARVKFERSNSTPPLVLHDLRRTARSLMAAAGVPTLHAELVMGHAQQGVVGIYDRHRYEREKAEALLMLANRIRDIVAPPPDNVHKLAVA